MKKGIMLGFLLLLFCAVLSFGEEETIKLNWLSTDDPKNVTLSQGIYELEDWYSQEVHTFSKADLIVDEQGWVQFGVKNPAFRYTNMKDKYFDPAVIDTPFVIMGGQYIVFFESKDWPSNYSGSPIFGCVAVETKTVEEVRYYEANPGDYYLPPYNFGVKEVTATSHFTETLGNKRVEYTSDGMNYIYMVDWHPYWIRKRPWVEGVAGSGIDESLTITFNAPAKEMLVLNGYVDPLERYLYKANNRLKVATIESLDLVDNFKFDYTFEDIVQFSEISFPENTAKVKLTIKEVYKGEKWDDTAISAVLLNTMK